MTSSIPQQDLFQSSDKEIEPTPNNNQSIDQYIGQSTDQSLFLTPNNRLAREFSKPSKQSNAFVTQKIVAYSLGNYESMLWDQLLRSGEFLPACKRILKPSQIEYIWQDIITICEPDILNINQTAKLCAKAFDLEAQYCVPDEPELYSDEEKYVIYLKFKALFEQKLSSLNAICASQKTPLILAAFKAQQLTLPEKITTYDLDQIPQIWTNIFEYFAENGVGFDKKPLIRIESTNQKIIACDDLEHEIEEMINDVYQFMCKHPDKTVALIVHDLANLKNKLKVCLNRVY